MTGGLAKCPPYGGLMSKRGKDEAWARREPLVECPEPYKSKIDAVLNLWLENYITASEARRELLAVRHEALVVDDGWMIIAKSRVDLRKVIETTASVLDALRIGFMAIAWAYAEEAKGKEARRAIVQQASELVTAGRRRHGPAGL
jgi:hypothetical protein